MTQVTIGDAPLSIEDVLAVARGGAEGDLGPAARHREDIFDAQRGVADRDLCHGDGLLSRRACSSGTTSAGADATGMPAASRAVFFSAAVPDEPSTMAPAWPVLSLIHIGRCRRIEGSR